MKAIAESANRPKINIEAKSPPTSAGDKAGTFCLIHMLPQSLRELYTKLVTPLLRVEIWGQSALLLLLRLVYGFMFAQAGWGKLSHFDQSVAYFSSLGMPAPQLLMPLAASVELLGGLALLLGLASRLAALSLSFVMLTAYATAHAAEAFGSLEAFTRQEPYPYLVAALIVLAFGAGRLSMDAMIAWRLNKLKEQEAKCALPES